MGYPIRGEDIVDISIMLVRKKILDQDKRIIWKCVLPMSVVITLSGQLLIDGTENTVLLFCLLIL